jgi:hypothetical protein
MLNLDTRWRWVMSFMSQPLYAGKESPLTHLNRRLDGHHRRSGCFAEEKIRFSSDELNHNSLVVQLVV